MESLDISIENLADLKLKLTITVPKAEVKETYDNCYRNLNSKVNINGFRKGKVPRSVLEKRFEKHMKQEALESLVPQNFEKALRHEDLKPAGEPQFGDLEVIKNKPLKFTAIFEVWPEFKLPEPESFNLEVKEIEITDEEREAKRKEHLERASIFVKKEGVAEETDQVLMNFTVVIDGNETAKEDDYEYVLGSNQFLPEVEEALKGMQAADEKKFTVQLPETHQEESLRGKETEFTIELKEVRGKQLPEVDDKFLKTYGDEVDSVDDFDKLIEKEIIDFIEYQNSAAYRASLKEQLKVNLDFQIPEDISKEEQKFQLESIQRTESDKKEDAEDKLSEDAMKEQAEKEAAENLRLAVYFQKMLENDDLNVDDEEVKRRFIMNAQMLGMDPNELIQQEHGKQFYQETYQMVQEDTVLDYLVNQVLK